LIPLQCEYYAFEGLGRLLKTYKLLKKRFNVGIELEGILLTMYDHDENISRKIANSLRSNFNNMIFKTIIPRDTHLKESACYNKPLAFRNIKSVGARCYLELANEIVIKRNFRN
jgi:chromosome partitioning protein